MAAAWSMRPACGPPTHAASGAPAVAVLFTAALLKILHAVLCCSIMFPCMNGCCKHRHTQVTASSPCQPSAHPPLPLVQVPEDLKRDCLLFYYPDCEQLARRVAECSEGKVELAEITWK